MLQIVQAFDRAPIEEIATDYAAALEAKLQAAEEAFRDRDAWLKPHERMAILRKLAGLLDGKRDHFARQIAREGGKPLTDAIIETTRAIDGVQNAADELRNFAGREIPMGLSPAAAGRRPLGLHDEGADRHRRGDLGLQPSAQPDRPSGRAGDRDRLSRHRQAGRNDAAVMPRLRRAGARGRSARGLVPELHPGEHGARREARHRPARRLSELHRLGQGRLVSAFEAGAWRPLGRCR